MKLETEQKTSLGEKISKRLLRRAQRTSSLIDGKRPGFDLLRDEDGRPKVLVLRLPHPDSWSGREALVELSKAMISLSGAVLEPPMKDRPLATVISRARMVLEAALRFTNETD